MTLLSNTEIEARLQELPGWNREAETIVREFELADFVGSVRFVDSIVAPAEEMGHHPDVAISWNRVTVTISTHSEGGLTAADFKLAGEINGLAP